MSSVVGLVIGCRLWEIMGRVISKRDGSNEDDRQTLTFKFLINVTNKNSTIFLFF